MNDSFSFPLPGLGRARPLWLDEIEVFLELMQDAALLVEQPEGRIMAANTRLLELSNYTHNELAGLKIEALIPDWDAEAVVEHLSAARRILRQRSKTRLRVSVLNILLVPQWRVLLVIITPETTLVSPGTPAGRAALPQEMRPEQTWEGLCSLAGAFQEASFEPAVTRLLEAGRSLTGAGYLAFYRLQEDNPIAECYPASSEIQTPASAAGQVLPAQLTAHDLMRLNAPRLWEASQRSPSNLHRAARTAGLTYLASSPVGQGRATIGLLAAGGRQEGGLDHGTSQYLQEAVCFLAALLGALFQLHARLENQDEALAQKADRLQIQETVEENSREGVVLLDPDLNIRRLNPSAELMLGYASQEVAGHPVEKVLIGPEDLLPALAAAQAGSPTHNLGATRLYRRNGDAFMALLRIFPVMQGQVTAIIVFITDQSEQEQIQLHTQQLEHRALLGEVTAIFAHEVRNPINNISTGLQLMAMNLPPEDAHQENITRMLQDCDRLAELIRSVLAFSRPAEYEMETLDLPLLLRRLLDRLRPRITRLNVQYDLALTDGCPPVRGNLRALEQVFSNLITNALQAMGEEGGHLVIKVQPVEVEWHSYVEVSVTDTGPGIPHELHDKIFQPFFTTGRGGTGLGLAIAKRILTAHKGDIRLESFPGGTIFSVRLPAELS